MESLNDILRRHVEIHGRDFEHKRINVSLDLDPDIPTIYPDQLSPEGTPEYIDRMLGELTGEQTDAHLFDKGLTKLRYGTVFVDGVQYLIVEHNGKVVPNETLDKLNANFERIAKGEHRQGRVTGNVRAALQAHYGNGEINMENHSDREYKVETTVKIPLP